MSLADRISSWRTGRLPACECVALANQLAAATQEIETLQAAVRESLRLLNAAMGERARAFRDLDDVLRLRGENDVVGLIEGDDR